MSTISRTYTFTDGTTAYGSQVETEFSTIVNAWNNHDAGTSAWTKVKISSSETTPLDIISSGATTQVSIDNTAANGDPLITFKLSGTAVYSLGVDDSDSDALCLTLSGTMDGTNTLRITSTTFDLNGSGSVTQLAIDNTAADGDPILTWKLGGTALFSFGVDDSDSDSLCLTAASTLNGANILRITGTTIATSISNSGNPISWTVANSSNTASSDAKIIAQVAGTSAGDAFVNLVIAGSTNYSLGIDNSDSDALCITAASSLNGTNLIRLTSTTMTSTVTFLMPDGAVGATSIGWSGDSGATGLYRTGTNKIGFSSGSTLLFEVTNSANITYATFTPSGAGSISTGDGTNYWNDISYKTLTDRGCLGWFDEGVELQDGRIVSDCEAIASIEKHPTKKTIYGVAMLNYKTFPKVSYKKAESNGVLLARDEEDEPIGGSDGVEMTAMQSIMLGAIKELHGRVKNLEK